MKRFALPVILLLAFILRVIWLDKYPIGFTPDEASFGYDALSILNTGKDQWGHALPLMLESFGDFKSPLYTYLSVPFVLIFGLSKFSVRLPNAILGALAVLVVYLLTKKLFKVEKMALFSSLLFAISPWHIMLSRGAFEANLTTIFMPLGVLLFLSKRYLLASIVLGLNLFTYHSAKFVTPLVFFSLIVLYKDQIKEKTKDLWISVFVFLIFVGVTGYTLFQGAGSRATERSITSGALEEAFIERTRSNTFFHNKYSVVAERFLRNYVTYFSPQFFFTEGPKEGTYGMIPGRGVLYLFVIPFILGARKLFYQGKFRKELTFLLIWILISPIPASLATGVGYHANRAAIMTPAIEVILGVGMFVVYEWLGKRKVLVYAYTALILFSFVFFLEDYFVQSTYKIAKPMLYGNYEVAEWVSSNLSKDEEVIVDKSLSEPHIYFAFSEKIDPIIYQEATRNWKYTTWVDQIPEYSLGRYIFKDINTKDLVSGKVLIGRPEDFSIDVSPEFTIRYPDGNIAILVVRSESQEYAFTY